MCAQDGQGNLHHSLGFGLLAKGQETLFAAAVALSGDGMIVSAGLWHFATFLLL